MNRADDDTKTRAGTPRWQAVALDATQVANDETTMSPAETVDLPDLVSQYIGRFVVRGFVGQGAMGAVYAAEDEALARKVAIKLLHRSGAQNSEGQLRMLREAQALARLSHSNVVQIYEVGEFQGEIFIAMEFVEGETLRSWVQRGSRTSSEILRVFRAAGEGLAAAHDAGLTHRDFKPDNVLVGGEGQVKVADFGLARLGQASDAPNTDRVEAATASPPRTVTQTGVVIGTPAYMAPEQRAGIGADARSDQFSFCVALYEALHGERPFRANNPAGLRREIERWWTVPRASGKKLPARIARALRRGLAFDPAERYPGMHALLDALKERPFAAPAPIMAALVGLTLVVAGALAWTMFDPDGGVCTQGPEQMAPTWNPDRELAMRAAFTRSSLGYANDALDRTLPELDGYAGRWTAAYARACVAHQSGESSAEQLDQRMACLRDRRDELDALVGVLLEGSREAIENSSQAARALTPVEHCDQPGTRQVRAPPPEIADEVATLFRELARIKAEYTAGLYDSGLARSTAALERARALAYRPALAEVLGLHGLLLIQKGRFPEAEATLSEAGAVADGQGDDRLRAEALASLALVIGERQSRHAEGLRVVQQAWGAIERMAGAPEIEAWLLIAEGAVLRVQGDPATALERLERALDLAERASDDEDRLLALGELGNVAIALRDYPTAERSLNEAIELARRTLGPRHPKLVYLNNNLASLYVLDGRPDVAELLLEEALQLARESLGPEHPTLATVLDSMGLLRLERGDPRGAIRQFDRARVILEAEYGPLHSALMPVILDMMTAQVNLDAVADASASADRALAIRDDNGGESPHDDYLAHVLLELEPKLPPAESERAGRYLDLSLRIARAHNSVPTRIAGLAALARREHLAGKAMQAREHIAEAAELELAASPELDPIVLGRARLALADALWRIGERQRGLALAGAINLPDVGADAERAALDAWLAAAQAGHDPP